ncbi:MAG: hypothetical protein AAF773_05115 [Cyanobacteria bacterium P01_D01_bin.115]
MPEQLTLLDTPLEQLKLVLEAREKAVEATKADGLPKPAPQPPKPPPQTGSSGLSKDAKFTIGDVVTVTHLNSDRFMAAGPVAGYDRNGQPLVYIGLSEPYACSESRATTYTGVVMLWRLGQAAVCDLPDCALPRDLAPFACQQCNARSEPHWWFTGNVGLQCLKPRWPDAMWFPTGYDPNTRRFEGDA